MNLVDLVVEVHGEPVTDGPRRAMYRTVSISRPGETLTSLAARSARIAVEALLPPIW